MSSKDYGNADPLAIAKQAERDLNSHSAKQGTAGGGGGDSATESGVDTAAVEGKFPGASVTYGSAASGVGDNREIPESEGGNLKADGKMTKARDFEGEGGPEDKEEIERRDRGGDDGVGMRAARGTQ